jgi:hypothetical protein
MAFLEQERLLQTTLNHFSSAGSACRADAQIGWMSCGESRFGT